MRICSPQLGISPVSSLGGTVYDREILKGLAGLGVEVEILLPEGMLHKDVPGWRVHKTPRHIFYYYEYSWIFSFYLFRLWRNPGFDLLRVHSPTIGLLGWLFKKLTGGLVVAHYHHLEDDKIHNLINSVVIGSYDLITTDSQFCVEQLVSTFGVERERLAIVYPGVDIKYRPSHAQDELKKNLGITGKRVLFHLGSLKPRKNLLFLLDVLAEVHREEPDTLLIIGGSGIQKGLLKERARELGLSDEIIFTGYISEDEKVNYYNLADVFVLPSLLEGFGMVAAEAMACGKPVVASNVCSLPEVVDDEKTGFLADPYDVDDFASKILRLLCDKDLCKQMGQAGRERTLRRFSWDAAAARTKEVYEYVLSAQKRS